MHFDVLCKPFTSSEVILPQVSIWTSLCPIWLLLVTGELMKLEVQSKDRYQAIASTELGVRTVQVIIPPN